MGVDDVAFNHLVVVVFPESGVHRTRVNLLGCFEEQPVLVKGHLDHGDVVGLGQTGHEIAQGCVEPTTSAGGDHVGWEGPGDDLFDQDSA